jgi:hypothetical protein
VKDAILSKTNWVGAVATQLLRKLPCIIIHTARISCSTSVKGAIAIATRPTLLQRHRVTFINLGSGKGGSN